MTYNSALVIAETLDSLEAADPTGLEIEFLVRDNGSRDDTLALLQRLAHKVGRLRLLPGGDNVGYGRGHNAIFASTDCDIYVVCNPDILVEKDFFARTIDFLHANPGVGIMSPRMTFSDGTLQYPNRRHPTLFDLALRRFLPTALQGPFRARMARYEMADVGYDRSVDVPFCSGALMVCRADVHARVGGFDDRYFLYFEDADLSRKYQAAGWRTVYNPDVMVVHGWQRAAHKSLRMALVFAHNALRYFNKWGWQLW